MAPAAHPKHPHRGAPAAARPPGASDSRAWWEGRGPVGGPCSGSSGGPHRGELTPRRATTSIPESSPGERLRERPGTHSRRCPRDRAGTAWPASGSYTCRCTEARVPGPWSTSAGGGTRALGPHPRAWPLRGGRGGRGGHVASLPFLGLAASLALGASHRSPVTGHQQTDCGHAVVSASGQTTATFKAR